jgi:hypothetical protein
MCESRVDVCEEELLRNFESLIEIKCTRDSLKSIGKNIWILMSSGDRLTTRELDHRGEVESQSYLSKIAPTHKGRTDICELSFGLFSEFMKQCLCNNEFEDSITKVFETFIGLCVSLCSFVEDATMDTSKDVETRVLRKNLERGEEFTHFRFKLHTIIAK